jgi:hypothetical protein
MTKFFIRAINSEFISRDEGDEYDRPETALAAGVQSAITIAVDEIKAGKSNTGLEVRVELEDGSAVLRSVIAMSVSQLMLCPG